MDRTTIIVLTGLIFLAALLYSSMGHAGASGYLAAMALFGVTPAVMKPTALTLNILVAVIGTIKFYRAGSFSWSLFWPFAVRSVPFAFFGGSITLSSTWYKAIAGLILMYAAYHTVRSTHLTAQTIVAPLPFGWALVSGSAIGLLSGLTGLGGGVFLSPLLLVRGWATTRQASAVAAAFILVNSVAGLLGHVSSVAALPTAIPVWAAAALAGGWLGAEYGSQRLTSVTVLRLLALVLVIAGVKLIVV